MLFGETSEVAQIVGTYQSQTTVEKSRIPTAGSLDPFDYAKTILIQSIQRDTTDNFLYSLCYMSACHENADLIITERK